MGYKEIYEESVKAGAVHDLTPTFFKWEKEGQSIVGRYKGRIEVASSASQGEYFHYIFDTDEGPVKFSLGASVDNSIGQLFMIDNIYHIEYLGKEKTKRGYTVNTYNIQELVTPETKPPEQPTPETEAEGD